MVRIPRGKAPLFAERFPQLRSEWDDYDAYVVSHGERFEDIATVHGISRSKLARLNGIEHESEVGGGMVLVVPAILIASQGISVLYLFLIADLLCSAAVFPVFYGLYARRFGGAAAVTSTLAGLAVGAWWFPWRFPEPGGSFLLGFGGALVVSTVGAILLSGRGQAYDFTRIGGLVKAVGE